MNDLLTVFGVNWKLLLAQGINFALLLAILSYFLYKPILRIIDERREKVAQGVRTAEEAGLRLKDAQTKSENIVGNASREAESLVKTARTRADERGAEILKTAEMRAQGILADASARAEEDKRRALKESEKEITRAAMIAAEKILRK
ncbi:MAG: F0F1 ATP synthase subunit B [Candidatus Kaiserbacteria bacterium]|nr:F0F1 ATP synthase subunit B [Candidatus Kaiserbacteria bacterium]